MFKKSLREKSLPQRVIRIESPTRYKGTKLPWKESLREKLMKTARKT